jgi:hypothetical protein
MAFILWLPSLWEIFYIARFGRRREHYMDLGWGWMDQGWGCWHLWELVTVGNIMGGKYVSTPGTAALHGCFCFLREWNGWVNNRWQW